MNDTATTEARATALTALLQDAPRPDDHDGVRDYLHHLAALGCAPLLVYPGAKVPAETRSPRQRVADDRAAQQAAKAAGRRNWQKVTAPRGVYLASDDPAVLDGYLGQYAKAFGDSEAVNVAVSVGRSRLVVVDCDTADQLAAFLVDMGAAGDTAPTVRTPGACTAQGEWIHRDGGHFYFTVPEGVELPDGVDSWTDPAGGYCVAWGPGRYVLTPPSVRAEGPYVAIGNGHELPVALQERIAQRAPAARRAADRSAPSTEATLIDEWSRAVGWGEILLPSGWTPTGQVDACGCPTWTAPGEHASPKSATGHESGCGEPRYDTDNPPLHIWTDNPGAPFEDYINARGSSTLSKLQAVALIDFDNDMGAAMEAHGLVSAPTTLSAGVASVVGPANAHAETYPPELWESRDSLRHIRDAALSLRAAPDAVLVCVLARLASRIPPRVRVDTGIMQPLPLNLYAALVSRTGKGKTSAMSASATIAQFALGWSMDPLDTVDTHSDCPIQRALGDEFPREGKVRTGEGIAEMFYGKVSQHEPGSQSGRPKMLRVKVRTNVMMTTDEGHALVKHILDPKSTVGETLREAWSGSAIGQSNADEEKYRYVPAGSYALGMIVGFHLSSLADLLTPEQLELGTPQRFLCAWSRPDPRMVTECDLADLVNPGPLHVTVPVDGLRLCDTLREHVNTEHMAGWLVDDDDEQQDSIQSQRVAMLARVAALLAILDSRTEADETGLLVVTEQDWKLAEVIFDTSCSITRLAEQDRRHKAAQRKSADRATQLAESIEDEDARSTPEGRAAARIKKYVLDLGPGRHRWSGSSGIRKKFNSAQIAAADAGLDQLVASGQVRRTDGLNNVVFIELIR